MTENLQARASRYYGTITHWQRQDFPSIVKQLLKAINAAELAQELSKKIHILDAIYFIKNAWKMYAVTKNTI